MRRAACVPLVSPAVRQDELFLGVAVCIRAVRIESLLRLVPALLRRRRRRQLGCWTV